MLWASSSRNPTAINPGVDERDKLATHVMVLIWTPTLISLSMLVQWMETCTNTIRTLSQSLVRCIYVSEGTLYSVFLVGSGSLSSPTREHRNFGLFYRISITTFSTVSECILLECIWIKRTFSSHSCGCFYVCIACASKNSQLIFYGRYLTFVRCRSRGPRRERKQSMCLPARWESHRRCTNISGR